MTDKSQTYRVRILIADDEEQARNLLSQWLRKAHGFEVDAVESGVKALQKVRRAKAGHYSVVLLDQIYDSGPTGLDVLSQIKALWPDLPVILFTGKEPEVGARALQMGAYSYLIKPFANEELAAKINGLLAQDTKLQQVAVTAREILGVPLCLVWVLDEAQGCFKIQAWSGPLDEEYIRKVKLDYYATPVQDFFRAGAPLSLADVTNRKKASQYRYAGLARQRKWKSLLTAPMLAQGHVIGILDAYTIGEIRDFDERDKQLMHAFATQAATAVHDAQLYRQSQALAEINQLLSGTYGVDTVLDVILDRVLQLVGTDIGWLYLLDHKDDELKIRAYRGLKENEVQKSRKLGDGITGWVAKYGKAQLVPNVEKDKRYISTRRDDIQSEVVVPLKYEDVVMGVLAVKSTHADAFTEEDMVLLSAFASQAALAVERDKLNRHIQRVSQMALTENVDKLVDYVTEAVHDLTGLPVALWLVDDKDKTKAKIRASRKLSPEYVRERAPELAHSITGEVLRTARMVDVEDLLHDPRVTLRTKQEAKKQGWKSMLVVPLLAGPGRAVGTLSIYRFVERKLTAWERDVLGIFASQAGMAMQSAERLETVQRLNQIGQSLSTLQASPEVLRHTLQQIAETARDELRADIVDLYQYLPERGEFTIPPIMVGKRESPKILTTTLDSDDVVSQIATSGHAIYASDAQSERILAGKWENGLKPRPQQRFVVREGIVSSAGVPLKVGEGDQQVLVGVLFVNYRHKRDFATEPGLRGKIETFASQAAVALWNARLLEKEQTLREISGSLSSTLEIGELAGKILDGLEKIIVYRKASLQLVQGDRRTLLAGRGVGDQPASAWLTRPISTDPLISRMVSNKLPLILSIPEQDPDWEIRPETAGVKSWVGLPLVYMEKVVALLTLDHDLPGFYTQTIENLLVSFGNQAAIAIHLARHIGRLKTLNRVSRDLSTKLDAQSIYEYVVEAVVQTVDCTHCTNFVLEELRLMPRASLPKDNSAVIAHSFALGEGLAGWVAQESEPVLVHDARKDERFIGGITRPDVDRSMIIVPVKVGGRVVSVISADQDQVNAFNKQDLEMVETLALQASAALQNARRVRDLEIVNNVTQDISAQIVNTQALFKTIVSRIAEQLNCTHCTLFLSQEEKGELLLIPQKTHGVRPQIMERRFKPGEGLAGWVFQHGESLVLPDVRQDRRFSPARDVREAPRSMLVAPVKIGGQTIGVISADQDQYDWFSEDGRRWVDTLAKQAAIAIENARLYEQLGQLQQVTRAISAESTDIQRTLNLIVKSLGQVFATDSCAIRLFGPNKSEFGYRVSTGALGDLIDRRPRPDGTSWYIVKKKIPIYVEDTRDTPPQDRPTVRAEAVKEGVKASAYLPLVSKENCIGVLYLDLKAPHQFSENEKRVLGLFADQAAIAIENAQLYKEQQERAAQLVQLQKVTASVLAESNTPDSMLGLITTGIADVFRSFSCTIRLYDPRLNQFEAPVASKGAEKRHTLLPPRSDGTSQYVLQTKQAVYAQDASETLPNGQLIIRPENHDMGVEAVAYLPLLLGEELVGRLAVSWDKSRHFSENDKHMLELFASQAAVTIKVSRLYSQLAEKNQQLDYLLNRKIRDLQAVYQVSQQLTSGVRLSEQDVLALIHEQTEPLMDTDNMYIALYDEVTDAVRFPLMFVDGQPKLVDSRSGGKGRTEWIIRNQQPIYIETCVESEVWYKAPGRQEYIGESFASWIGVPMMAGDKVMGVIATYHKTKDHVYTKDDLEVLSLMASQAAIVLQNARMWEAMQKLSEDLSAGALLDVA